MKRLALAAIRFYQRAISPLTPPSCRFTPTCSEYARVAIERYGLAHGGLLATRRLLRCHPFCPGGHDPVPERPGARLEQQHDSSETDVPEQP